ncbi:MAG: arylsulfatase [Planctomycetaceae bacterium]
MHRLTAVFAVVCLALNGFAALTDAAETAARRQRPPNVVFIVADDLGYSELGCFGQEKIRTPRIDELAAEGMRLTNHYCGNPVCATSRCVLMTGKHSGHATIRDNRGMARMPGDRPEIPFVYGGQEPIPDDEVTVAELFKAQGYATAAFGKWGLGATGNSGDPLAQGFDHFVGYQCQAHAHNFYPYYLVRDHEHVPLPGNNRDLTGETYAPDVYTEAALEFIRGHQDEPFFVYYPTIVPHLALQVPEDSLNEYKGKWDDPAYEGGKGYLPHPHPRAAYAAMVTRMDRDIGRLMDLVSELGLKEETIFVFTSDNGPTYDRLGGSDSEFFASAGPLRGLKGSIYEGGIRVPLVVRWPGHVPAGSESDLPTAFYDWMPTLMDLIGKPETTPASSDGLSFASTLLGRGDQQSPHEYLVWEFPGYGGQQAVRMGDWKGVRQNLLVKNAKQRNTELQIELYNLKEDVGESRDVAAEHPEVVAEIAKIMRAEHTVSKLFPFPPLDALAAE